MMRKLLYILIGVATLLTLLRVLALFSENHAWRKSFSSGNIGRVSIQFVGKTDTTYRVESGELVTGLSTPSHKTETVFHLEYGINFHGDTVRADTVWGSPETRDYTDHHTIREPLKILWEVDGIGQVDGVEGVLSKVFREELESFFDKKATLISVSDMSDNEAVRLAVKKGCNFWVSGSVFVNMYSSEGDEDHYKFNVCFAPLVKTIGSKGRFRPRSMACFSRSHRNYRNVCREFIDQMNSEVF